MCELTSFFPSNNGTHMNTLHISLFVVNTIWVGIKPLYTLTCVTRLVSLTVNTLAINLFVEVFDSYALLFLYKLLFAQKLTFTLKHTHTHTPTPTHRPTECI